MKTFTHQDYVTKRPITYNEHSMFVIYSKSYYHKKRPIKYFPHDQLTEALKFFYDLEIPKDYKKYFYVLDSREIGDKDGEKIYMHQGYLPIAEINKKSQDLLQGKGYTYKKVIGINLNYTPATLQMKLEAIDLGQLPPIKEKWTKAKIAFCLLSYFVNLSYEDKRKILLIGYKKYLMEKLESGKDQNEFKKFSELVDAVENDLDFDLDLL